MYYLDKKPKSHEKVVAAPYWQRVKAYTLDLIFILIIGLLTFIATDAIYSSSKAGRANNQNVHALRIKSGLYLGMADDKDQQLSENISENQNTEVFYLYRLEYFYKTAESGFNYELSPFFTEDTPFDYEKMVLRLGEDSSVFVELDEPNYFVPSSGTDSLSVSVNYTFKDTLSASQKNSAWVALYTSAINTLDQDPTYFAAVRKTRNFIIINLTISAFIGTIIPSLLFPLFVGHGRSFGKFMTRLAVVDTNGYKVKLSQVIVRYLFFALVETALNFILFFIPLLLTSGVLTLTKKNRALHDLVSKTYVVDAKTSKIFNDKEAEKSYYEAPLDVRETLNNYFTEAEKAKEEA